MIRLKSLQLLVILGVLLLSTLSSLAAPQHKGHSAARQARAMEHIRSLEAKAEIDAAALRAKRDKMLDSLGGVENSIWIPASMLQGMKLRDESAGKRLFRRGLIRRQLAAATAETLNVMKTVTAVTNGPQIITQTCFTLVSDPSQTFCNSLITQANGNNGGTTGTDRQNFATTTTSLVFVSQSAVQAAATSPLTAPASANTPTITPTQAGGALTSASTTLAVAPSQPTSVDAAAANSQSVTSAESVAVTTSASVTDAATITAAVTDSLTASVTDVSAAAADAATSTAAVVIPGRSLQVLPIGLGIFAGVSVIAMVVVGIVTYERRKYRRQFRDRKLAEKGGVI